MKALLIRFGVKYTCKPCNGTGYIRGVQCGACGGSGSVYA